MVDKNNKDDIFDPGSEKSWDKVISADKDPSEEDIKKTIQSNSRHIQRTEEPENQNKMPERFIEPTNSVPSTSIDTAHNLISSSRLTSYMPELDKEIKLSNLSAEEKGVIWKFQSVWEDLIWLREHQNKRIEEFEKIYGRGSFAELNPEDALMEEVELSCATTDSPEIFDALSSLRKSERAAVLSRGTRGFERIQQVSTIQTNINENKDQSETKPGFIQKVTGGLKR